MSSQKQGSICSENLRNSGGGKELDNEHTANSSLPPTGQLPQPAALVAIKEVANSWAIHVKDEESQIRDRMDSELLSAPTGSGLPEPPMKPKPLLELSSSASEGGGHGRQASTSSIWISATTTLKNLMIGKPQAPNKDIVTVVPDPKIKRERVQNLASQSNATKVDKGKGRASSPEASSVLVPSKSVLYVLDDPERPTQHYGSNSKADRRPSVPPPRLSSIAHSLPTTSSHPPPSFLQSTTSPSSIQSANSTTSQATGTSATTATDEENQAAALAALNAVIHSVGTGYTQPLTSRAAQLHANDVMLAEQRERLLQTSSLLARDTAALQKLALESNNKLKSFGDLQNWSDTLDNDLNAIEETLRLVERGSLDVCSECEGPIEEEEEQRWCGECGKGFHLACGGEDPDESLAIEHREPGLGDDDNAVTHDEDHEMHDKGKDTHGPANVELPSSLPSTSMSQHPYTDLAAMGSLFSAFSPAATAPQVSVPSARKPSSMFEWGGIPDSVRLDDEEGSGNETGSGSDWSGEDWRCQECRLKDDLAAIGRGL